MKKKILIIQGSSLKKINIKTDTSFFLGLEAQRRSYQIYYYEPKDLSFINGKVTASCSKVKFLDNPKQPVKIISKSVLNLLQAKLVLIRSEPPFNQQYINTTFILEYMPQTLISENLNEIKSFLKSNKKIVMKPIESYSGNDVKLVTKFNKSLINKFTKKYHHLMFQKFIPKISKGDKRVFIINGKIKGAISRIPKKGSILSNMSKGASAKKIKISQREMKISKIVATELKKQNIYFAGIDFIQGKLIGDINVTSPTGLKTYYDLTGVNLGKYFFDDI